MQRLLDFCVRPIRYALAHPWRTLGGACALLVLGTLGLYKWIEYCSYCDLRAAIAETDALSPRWRLEEIEADRPQVPDDENSALVIQRVVALMDQAERQSSVKLSDDIELLEELVGRSLNERVDDQSLQKLQRALQTYGPAVDEAIRLKDFPRGRWPLKLEPEGYSTSMPHMAHVRRVARFVDSEALRAAHVVDAKRVVESIMVMLNTYRSVEGEPATISVLVGFVSLGTAMSRFESTLALMSMPDAELERLDKLFTDSVQPYGAADMFRYERGVLHVFFTSWEEQRVSGSDIVNTLITLSPRSPPIPSFTLDVLYRPMISADHAFGLRMMNRSVDIATKPDAAQEAMWLRWKKDLDDNVKHGPFVYRNVASGTLLPFCQGLARRFPHAPPSASITRAAIAAERFRLVEVRWPESVDELVPRFASEPFIDPFDGQPLKLVRRDDGITIYSIGEDRIDDHGAFQGQDNAEPADLCFRLWDPEHRGLPAKPRPATEVP